MGVGASLLGLLGNKDPREALLQAVAGGGTSTQPAGGVPYAAAPGGGGGATGTDPTTTSGVQASQPADALMSPPDLAKLYQDVLSYDRKAAHFDRGMGLIGSAISQDGNRAATYDAFAGSGAGGNFNSGQSFSGMVDLVQGINKQNLARQQRAAMMARIPTIAKQYGIDPETAMYLYDTGKLDSLITEAEKPNSELRDLGNGQVALIDKTDGTQRGLFGDPKKNIQVVDGPEGKRAVDLNAQQDGALLAGPKKSFDMQKLANGQIGVFDKDTGQMVGTNGPEDPNVELRNMADGTVGVISKKDGSLLGTVGPKSTNNQVVDDPTKGKTVMDLNAVTPGTVVAGPDNRTPDTKNYEYYEAQEKAAGRIPLSFNEWDMQNRIKSNPNGMDPEEKAFKEKRGQQLGEKYVNIQTAADSALEQLTMYDAVEKGLETGVRTGSLGESEQALRKFGSMLGLDTDPTKIAGGELVTAIQNRMALQMRNPESGMGMPGSLSDKDIDFLKAAQIGMGTSGEGNKTLLEVYRRLAKRKIELADLADAHADKFGSLRGFNAAATKFHEENPLFEDLQVGPKSDEAAAREAELLKKYGSKK